ncbi:MAG TPA: beta-phosphoglucomutase, partial [Candidatus Limnocylindrales bacterium]|nr:beta-phosphoglucomutase [Candidatus Limnocylindrales bacterium]
LLGDETQTQVTLDEFLTVADGIYIQEPREDDVVEQFDGYFGRREVDLSEYAERSESMQALLGMVGLAETQVIKQPDVLMLAALLPETFTDAQLVANYDYYNARTDHSHGSSLGPGIQALLAARLGRLDEAYEHFQRAARVDLADVRGNTADGTHAASAGALWQAIVFGFAGVNLEGEKVRTKPQLPPHWRRLKFRIAHRGRTVDIDLRPTPQSTPGAEAIRGLIFDLDGVVTDTAESHYLAWQRLADEEGLPFDRAANEALRGISRRQSLALLLGTRSVSDEQATEMADRKNRYYRDLIAKLSPDDVLPGAIELIDEARQRGLKVSLASASKNAREVLDRLGITDRFDAIADGNSVTAPKPAPDLFLFSARQLGLKPAECVVFEDASDGVDAALAAEMLTVGIGPDERVGQADVVLADGFASTNLDDIFNRIVRSREASPTGQRSAGRPSRQGRRGSSALGPTRQPEGRAS